jgi:hypothetical protein
MRIVHGGEYSPQARRRELDRASKAREGRNEEGLRREDRAMSPAETLRRLGVGLAIVGFEAGRRLSRVGGVGGTFVRLAVSMMTACPRRASAVIRGAGGRCGTMAGPVGICREAGWPMLQTPEAGSRIQPEQGADGSGWRIWTEREERLASGSRVRLEREEGVGGRMER